MNQKEYELLFKSHYRFLCSVSYQITNNVAVSEDIVQNFFYYLWQQRDQLTFRLGFKAYAYTAVKNKSITYASSIRKTEYCPVETAETATVDPYLEKEQSTDLDEQVAAMLYAIEQLPEQQRRVFLLSNRDELSYAQIATALNISVNTVKTHIKLAYQFLRRHCLWLLLFFF